MLLENIVTQAIAMCDYWSDCFESALGSVPPCALELASKSRKNAVEITATTGSRSIAFWGDGRGLSKGCL